MDTISCSKFCYCFQRSSVVKHVNISLYIWDSVVEGRMNSDNSWSRNFCWWMENSFEFIDICPVNSFSLRSNKCMMFSGKYTVDRPFERIKSSQNISFCQTSNKNFTSNASWNSYITNSSKCWYFLFMELTSRSFQNLSCFRSNYSQFILASCDYLLTILWEN